ncbi:cbb3-type cytochrome oxidase assembly protein CcoS [Pseudorhodobacter sp.]|uniref:cbb3-type cytochrome oxidase assembly protein CcoS n=1 Tax=Pseudorhodobacter sp. TaxID=1934400 RepID=UPI002649B7EE|nr:cbb3-type cytochrome oxidase assembly protein CcoS [Pseudorhodobacter sp.]MDN5785612.1 cbb3-type cytochrome oxidase assembly protein CcoS [Pseudorhodobacter sp.]
MNYFFLIPISVFLGLVALYGFYWSLRNDQYDDLAGAAERILPQGDAEDRPLPPHAGERKDG